MFKPKQKKCKHCKEFFEPQKPLQYICSPLCAIAHTRKLKEKEWNKEKKVLKEKLKTLTDYEKEARKPFQQFIRIRDKDRPCISCGALTAKQWDAGHFYKAELFSGLIFDERNCHKQCSQCNDIYSGNELMYREGLIKRYGNDYVMWLEENKDRLRNYKYTKNELIEIKNKYKEKIKELQ